MNKPAVNGAVQPAPHQWLGTPENASEPRLLKAGPLQAELLDGRLMNIRFHGQPLIDEVYYALRDPDWATIPYSVRNERVRQNEDAFEASFEAVHSQGGYQYRWQANIRGSSDGSLVYATAGEALGAFQTNRVGFCVLHPIALAGLPCRITQPDQHILSTSFPDNIAPHQPFTDIAGMDYTLGACRCAIRFEGEIFECEDQRNWTDASFKTYCTPLRRPCPLQMAAGDTVRHAIHIRCAPAGEAPPAAADGPSPALDWQDSIPLDAGFSAGTCLAAPLSPWGLERAAALHADHLRVDLRFDERDSHFMALLAQAETLAASVRLAVFLTDNWQDELDETRRLINLHPGITHLMVHQAGQKVIREDILLRARQALARPGLRIGSGTDAYFTQLNREPLPGRLLDFVCYSNNPQVHAFDNLSIMQTTLGQAANARSAAALYPSLPIHVSPLTLKIRWNPDATGPRPGREAREARQVDHRQMSLFAAAFMLRSLITLASSGAQSVSLFELAGPRGLFADLDQPLPEGFPASPGMRYPAYHALRQALAILRGGGARAFLSPACCALANGRQVLIANTTGKPQTLSLTNWPAFKATSLNQHTAARFAAADMEDAPAGDGHASKKTLALEPYALLLGHFV